MLLTTTSKTAKMEKEAFSNQGGTEEHWDPGLRKDCHHHVLQSQVLLQSKSLLTSTSGATRVHTYRAMQTQLEQIFTHTEGHLLVMFSLLESGLPRHRNMSDYREKKRAETYTCIHMHKDVCTEV